MVPIDQLAPEDKQSLRDVMDAAAKRDPDSPCCMGEAFQRLQEEAPTFLRGRIDQFSEVLTMSMDPDWDLPLLDQSRVFAAGKYLRELKQGQLCPIECSVLSALALDLVGSDMRGELELYKEFLNFRQENGVDLTRPEWLRHKREQTQSEKRSLFGSKRSNIRLPGPA
ncbi:MAG: hypothetical protein AAF438_05585 [Pseudomonadota bacterium]